MLNEKRLKEIKEMCDKATPGNWKYELNDCSKLHCDYIYSDANVTDRIVIKAVPDYINDDGYLRIDLNDLEFIINARNDIPNLLEELERLQSEISIRDNTIMNLKNQINTAFDDFLNINKDDLEGNFIDMCEFCFYKPNIKEICTLCNYETGDNGFIWRGFQESEE